MQKHDINHIFAKNITMSINKSPIPISLSLDGDFTSNNRIHQNKSNKRLLLISVYAILIAAFISLIAKLLIYLISLVTNLSFFGVLSIHEHSPAFNNLGLWVIAIPAVGGLIVGIMALYGSKAIRGHGIPEAMEQILTNQSKIKPAITYLKPLSSAIAIGTGGPFGAEGPIIATGGALGSTLGQLLHITNTERKILLASGAVAGMTAIFGTPIAAIFLAIELLLFEFSPRAIIAVSLACITGAGGHHLLFSAQPVFYTEHLISVPTNIATFYYSLLGIVIGFIAIGITKAVYAVEDLFEQLPIHWMWWPAIGGLAVGIIGYFAPRTLGVGYENITALLSGNLPFYAVLSLCLFKFCSWAIALGSGTSGGTLAPLLTIGAATGILIAHLLLYFFPDAGIDLGLAALIGMSAMFAGASRALLTSIIFALETTGQFNALTPLLAACLAAYAISYLFMRNTIMTEKISRRGVHTPETYEPDPLSLINVRQVMEPSDTYILEDTTLLKVKEWINDQQDNPSYYIVVNTQQAYVGIVSTSNLLATHHDEQSTIGALIQRKAISLHSNDNLRTAFNKFISENIDVIPVVEHENRRIIGIISYPKVLKAFQDATSREQEKSINISLKRKRLRFLSKHRKASHR